jgi:pimeloyl-ACP methyl ester carboxylesterase
MKLEAPAVITVHGLWMGRWAMAYLDRQLADGGFRVFRFGYPAVRDSLAGNAAALARFAARIEGGPIHLVGHSLGGIVIFAALQGALASRAGRVVMLGSPLTGSLAADRLARIAPGRALLGHSVGDWLSRPIRRWSLANELGIIAGTRSLGMGRLVAPGLPRPNDGAVSVEETRLPGAREHLLLPVSHSGMLLSKLVGRCTLNFLQTGRFGAAPPA